MLISMTGYGQAAKKGATGPVIVEILSKNRKFLETSVFNLPDAFFGIEIEIKKEVQEVIKRGQVVVRLRMEKEEGVCADLPSKDLLQELKQKWVELAIELGYEKKDIDLSFILDQSDFSKSLIVYSQEDKKVIFSCLKEALKSIVKMKKEEGELLQKDFEKRLTLILSFVEKIEKNSENEPSLYRDKLVNRVGDYFSESDEDRERILKEIVLFSDRVDISEEIVRLKSHLDQFKKILKSTETVLGKKLDFICQEIFREINTISSKTTDLKNTDLVIQIKSELEKIREQVQNVE